MQPSCLAYWRYSNRTSFKVFSLEMRLNLNIDRLVLHSHRSFTRSHWLTKHVFAKRQLLPGALGWEFRVSCVFLSWSFLFELFFWYLRPHCPWSISRVKMRRFLCSRQHAEYCMEALHINKAICTRSTQSERLTSQQDPTVTALAILSSLTGTSTSTRIRM